MGDKKEYVKLWLSYRSYFEAYSAAEVGRLVLARWIIASREQSQSSAGVNVSFGLRFDGTLTNP